MSQITEKASQAQGQAQEVVSQAGQKLQEGTQQAREQASGQVRSQLDTRSTQAGEQVNSLASTLRSTGDQLRNDGNTRHADLADSAAERIERLGGYLTGSDGDRILSDIENFARRQPWTVAAVGFGLGLAASRLLKASSERRYESSRSAPAWESSYGADVLDTPRTGYPTGTGVPTGTGYPTGGSYGSVQGGLTTDEPPAPAI
jgi:hypothetical protein